MTGHGQAVFQTIAAATGNGQVTPDCLLTLNEQGSSAQPTVV